MQWIVLEEVFVTKIILKIGKPPRKHLFSSLYTLKLWKRKGEVLLKATNFFALSWNFFLREERSFLLDSAILAVEDLR